VIRSREPFKFWWATTISLYLLKLVLARWLLQRSYGVHTECDDRQGSTSDKRCSACGQRYEEVWWRFVLAPAHRATLAWRARESHVQARHHDVQLSSWTSSPVPDGCLATNLQRRITARSRIRQSTTAGSTPLQAWHICPVGFHCGWPVGVELAVRLPEDPAVGRDTFRKHLKTFLFARY